MSLYQELMDRLEAELDHDVRSSPEYWQFIELAAQHDYSLAIRELVTLRNLAVFMRGSSHDPRIDAKTEFELWALIEEFAVDPDDKFWEAVHIAVLKQSDFETSATQDYIELIEGLAEDHQFLAQPADSEVIGQLAHYMANVDLDPDMILAKRADVWRMIKDISPQPEHLFWRALVANLELED